MSDRARKLLREDVLRDYEPPHPSLETRVFDGMAPRPRPERARVAFQAVAVLAAAALVVVVLLAQHVAVRTRQVPGAASAPRQLTANLTIKSSQFISADVGWVLMDVGQGFRGPHALFGTRDAGRHWTEQLDFPSDITADIVFEDMQFWPDGHGEVRWTEQALPSPPGAPMPKYRREVLYRTTDGGRHWSQSVHDARTEGSTRFSLDLNQEWAFDKRLFPYTDPGVLIRTVDGGRTWTNVTVLPAALLLGTCCPGLFFRDSHTGWFWLEHSRVAEADSQGRPSSRVIESTLLFVTHDGGRTWAGQDLPLPPEALAMDVSVAGAPALFSAQEGLLTVVAVDPNAAKGRPGRPALMYALRTHDGGRTWASPVALPGDALMLGPTHWLMADGPGVRESVDGGITWTSGRPVPSDGERLFLSQRDFVDQRTVWARIGSGDFVRSTDAGRTWSVVRQPA